MIFWFDRGGAFINESYLKGLVRVNAAKEHTSFGGAELQWTWISVSNMPLMNRHESNLVEDKGCSAMISILLVE